MTIRLLDKLKDVVAFRAIRIESVCDTPASFRATREEMEQKSIDDFADQLSDHDNGDFFVGAFVDDFLVGVAALIHEKSKKLQHKAIIGGVYVTPPHRNKGVARELLSRIIQSARDEGRIKQVNLSVTASNEAAVKLYKDLVFLIFGTEPRAACVDGKYYDEHHMQLPL